MRILPFVTQYRPSVPNLKQILMRNWHLIQQQPLLTRIFKDPPIVSYKRGRSLKDILVRAKLYQAITRGWELCRPVTQLLSKLLYIVFTKSISSSGIPYIDMMFHRLSLCTESNAFSKSMKWVYRVAFHSLTCSSIFLRAKI